MSKSNVFFSFSSPLSASSLVSSELTSFLRRGKSWRRRCRCMNCRHHNHKPHCCKRFHNDNDAARDGMTYAWTDNEVESLLNVTLEYEGKKTECVKQQSDASRPQCSGRAHAHLSGHAYKVLIERLKLALFWFCLPFMRCCFRR